MIWLIFMVMFDPDGQIMDINTYHWEQYATLEECNEKIAENFAQVSDKRNKTLTVNFEKSYVLTVKDEGIKTQLLCSAAFADEKEKERSDEKIQRLIDEGILKND